MEIYGDVVSSYILKQMHTLSHSKCHLAPSIKCLISLPDITLLETNMDPIRRVSPKKTDFASPISEGI